MPTTYGIGVAAVRVYLWPVRLQWRSRAIELERGALMGILNVTPDSFSDGGEAATVTAAVRRARRMIAEGAAIVDVGGESTRPGASPVPQDEELGRVLPVVRALAGVDALVSVDTSKAAVAREALAAGADIVNDVTGLRDPAMRSACADAGAPAVIVHWRAAADSLRPSAAAGIGNEDVVTEVRDELAALAVRALADGVPSVVVDPGFGFGKSPEENLELVRRLGEIRALGYPLLLGASRKSTLGRVAGVEEPARRDPASVAAHLFGLARGADLLRVHDVPGHAQAVRAWKALEGPRG